MVVITIMSILAALIAVNSGTNVREELLGAAEIVSAEIAYTRSLAVTNNDKYLLTFSTSGNKFTLTHSGTNTALNTLPTSTFHTSLDTATSHVVSFATLPCLGNQASLLGVRQMSTSPVTTTTLEFGALGETTSTDSTVIWLFATSSDGARYLSITVNPISGLPSVGTMTATHPSGL